MKLPALTVRASTLTNACGIGWKSVCASFRNGRSGLRPFDLEWTPPLDTWIGRVDALEEVRMPAGFEAADCRNNRLAHLCLEQDGFGDAVAAAIARWGADRIGLFVGTTTSGILSTELAFRDWFSETPRSERCVLLDRGTHDMHATTSFVRRRLKIAGPAQTISTACASSAKAFASAQRSISAGLCDAAVVGGVDTLALSTLFGFKSLDLLSAAPCRPFAVDRDGISIGEGAGFALLDSEDGPIRLLGCGESSDAWHMSSPHPEGAGAAGAMRGALAVAGIGAMEIDYVNLHGTASRANDAAEDRAVMTVLGASTTVSSTKGMTGHTLGAAGITEALITVAALVEQRMPGTMNCLRVDPAFGSAIARESREQRMRIAMSNSFGFGGNNCALVFGRAS